MSSERPFSDGSRRWAWPNPDKYRFRFDGKIFELRVDAPGGHSPDLRALTLLEASAANKVIGGRKVEGIRILLGNAWKGKVLAMLLARVGLVAPRLKISFEVIREDARLPTPDPLAGWEQLLRRGSPLNFRGKVHFEVLRQGMDGWLAAVRKSLARASDDDSPSLVDIPVLVISGSGGRIHPRIHWIAKRLRDAGLPIETPDPEDAPDGFSRRMLECSLSFRRSLPISGMGRYREIEYEHILPDGKEKLGIWSKLWPNLDRILPTDERHPAFGNLNSSQAFAVNLFGGLKHTCLLAKALQVAFATGPLTDPNVTLEYFTPEFKKYLGEKGSHQTQVDVLATASEGARTRAFVIEVKLTEAAFGRCRGPFEEKNADKSICYPDSSGERRCRCFMASLEGRRYLELAERAFPLLAAVLGADGSCPIRLDGYQLARNLAVRAWLGGDLLPGAPPPPPPGPFEATFAVVSARDTPALSSGPLVALGSSPAERLSKLGVRWVDARHLVDAVSNEPTAGEFVEFMKSRYSPLFDEVAGQTG